MKYVTVKIGSIITQIAEKTDVDGYTIGVIETFLPDNTEQWSYKKEKEWIVQNNKRMKAICKFLNENNL